MKTPKKTGKKPEANKPAAALPKAGGAQESPKAVSKYADDDDDDYDLPLEEMEGFDDYNAGSYEDDDDY